MNFILTLITPLKEEDKIKKENLPILKKAQNQEYENKKNKSML